MEKNICLEYGCSCCCNPVKLDSKKIVGGDLPFRAEKGIFIPEKAMDHVRLKNYSCSQFDCQTGLCKDYANRPNICRNTSCGALRTDNKEEQARIISAIKAEKFIKLCLP